MAGPLLERPVNLQALPRHPDRRLVRVMLAKDRPRLAGRPGADEPLLQQDDPAEPLRGQMVGDAQAHDAAADDDGVRGSGHGEG